jgi:hypothetical protein
MGRSLSKANILKKALLQSKKQVMGRDANRSWEKKTALLCAGKARKAAGVEE